MNPARTLLSLCLLAPALAAAAADGAQREADARARLEAAHVEFTDARFIAAVQAGELQNVKLFLAAGMSPDTVDAERFPVLGLAIVEHHDAVMQALLDAGAKLFLAAGMSPDTVDAQRFPVLGLAVVEHHDAVMQALLDAGAKLSDDSWAASPLGLARLSANKKAEALLVKRGATLVPSEKAFEELRKRGSGIGKKQMFDAIEQGRTEIVALQLEAGMKATENLFKGNTPLHIAAAKGRIEIARLLMEHGADVNARNDAGVPVIGYAIVEHQDEMVKLLQDAGARE